MATIIRQNSADNAASGRTVQPVAFNFEDINDRANEYLEEVRREAAKIVQQAHEQAELVRRQAEAAGRAAAESIAHRMLEERISTRFDTFAATLEVLVDQTNAARNEWLQRWEQSAISVASAIAVRVIRRELEHEPEIQLTWVREALQLAAGANDVTLRLNPSDFELLGLRVKKLAETLSGLAPTQVIADVAVTPGGCVVQTRLGRIDQQIESQIARIEEELS